MGLTPHVASLTAIDVHVHVHNSVAGGTVADDSAEAAVGSYFGRLERHTVPEIAAMYRERRMACVVFTVDAAGFAVIRKGGEVTVTGLGHQTRKNVEVSGSELTLFEKRIVGSLFGSANPVYDIPRLLGLYRSGDLKLDELITRRYRLDEINQGYQDMLEGRNIRGIIVHQH